MICEKHEVADRLVTREGVRIRTILLPGILESGNHKGEVPLYKPFHEPASAWVVRSQPKQVILQAVFDERPKVGTGKKIDVQHHNKVRSGVQPGQVSPCVELPRSFRHLEWRENEMDVDIG